MPGGAGRLTPSLWCREVGAFEHGQLHGTGKATSPSGRVDEGEFQVGRAEEENTNTETRDQAL